MNIAEFIVIKRNQDFLIKISKIIILAFVSFSLFASAIPFHLGYDDVNYGIATINIAKGNFEITNDLTEGNYSLGKGAYHQFFPNSFVQTVYDTAIHKSSVGTNVIGSFFYMVGGFFGLLYFGPIITIGLLIIFERISTKLFGNLIGLISLLLIVADWQIFFVGLRYLTDNIFSLFFILGVFCLIIFVRTNDTRYILPASSFFALATFIRINGIVFFPIEILVILGYFVVIHMKKSKTLEHNNQNSEVIFKKQFFSKSNSKKFLKTSFYLLIPWIIFLIFWLNFNAYYFGDAETNYKEQMRATSIDEDNIINRSQVPAEELPGNNFQRLQLFQYYSVPLIPDPLYFSSIIISDTDLEVWRSDIWISYISFSILSLSLIFSLYFKINRKETIIFLLFIIGIVGFYSSSLVASDPLAPFLSQYANSRYMIGASSLSFILMGFILVEGWRKCFPKKPGINLKLHHSLKLIYLILVVVFFLALIVTIPAIQDFYQRGFHFNNPFEEAKAFENLEKLPEKSFIIGFNGRLTLLHTDTHFYPYGRSFGLEEDVDLIPEGKQELLKEILSEGYSAYAFKDNMLVSDKKYFQFLESNHGIVLRDYSNKFCKLELIPTNEQSIENSKSDPICFDSIKTGSNKIWNVTLKWPQ